VAWTERQDRRYESRERRLRQSALSVFLVMVGSPRWGCTLAKPASASGSNPPFNKPCVQGLELD
jgi:hypothetical protein